MAEAFRLALEIARRNPAIPSGCIVYRLLANGQPTSLVRHRVRCNRGTLACTIRHVRVEGDDGTEGKP